MKNKIIIIGSLPFPTGGVTSFLERFFYEFYEHIELFIDYIPSDKKKISSDKVKKVKVFFLFFLSFLPFYKRTTVFFNFSTPKSLILLTFMPKYNRRFCLLLHNGDLNISKNYFLSLLQKKAINRIDLVFSLSELQTLFYKKYSKSPKIKNVSSYLRPRDVSTENIKPSPIQQFLHKAKYSNKKVIMMNGYLKSYYNFIFAYEFAEKYNYKLCIFSYGPIFEPELLEFLCSKRNEDFYFHHGDLEQETFNLYLSLSDIYFRPNEVDSFGISCADAVFYGTKAIASDVCSRAPGVLTFPIKTLNSETILDLLNIEEEVNEEFNVFVDSNYLKLSEGLLLNETNPTRHG
jgi:glycosyltransferase involved in cell wall biosynthesis